MISKQVQRAMHYARTRGLAVQTGVWLRAKKMESSIAYKRCTFFCTSEMSILFYVHYNHIIRI